MSAAEQDLNELVGELNARLERRHIEATEQSGQIGDLKRELAEAIEQRDLAIAHDRQPYPTAWAYDQACKALEKHRQRADVAEAAIERVRRMAQVWVDIRPTHPTATHEGHVMAYAGQQILDALAIPEAPGGES